jgi:L-methionine (R)-S-oxide reductase
MASPQEDLLREFESFSRSGSRTQIMEHIAHRLHETKARYNWVGFYLVDPIDPAFLVVGPYAGSFTPNLRIPLHKGLCGAAAKSGRTVVVDDVLTDPRYLAGSSAVKSEIVVPVFSKHKFVAELDIESYFGKTFAEPEQKFVEACASIVGSHWEQKSSRAQ